MRNLGGLNKIIPATCAMRKHSRLMKIKPRIFIPEAPNNPLLEVLTEIHDGFLIFWYHWRFDGFIDEVEDYEPIMVILDDIADRICYLGTRAHWRYRFRSPEEGLVVPLQVLFEGSFHPALARTEDNSSKFERIKASLGLFTQDYEPEAVDSSRIPIMFRTGKDHPTAFLRNPIEDPKDQADHLHHGFCYHKRGPHSKTTRKFLGEFK
jgi:hypothetical protein